MAMASKDDVIQWVIKRANQLQGQLSVLTNVLNKNSGMYSIRTTDKSEVDIIRLILLSSLLTTLDPYLANTSIGKAQRQKLEVAAQVLGLSAVDLSPLSHIEEELFQTLGSLLD